MAIRSIRTAANSMRTHEKTPDAKRMAGTIGEAFDAIADNLDQLVGGAASTLSRFAAGTGPTQYSTADGTLTGAANNSNLAFEVSVAPNQVVVCRNGLVMTRGLDYTLSAGVITFSATQTPQPGDIITALVW